MASGKKEACFPEPRSEGAHVTLLSASSEGSPAGGEAGPPDSE